MYDPARRWYDTDQADVVRRAVAERGMVYLTTRQIAAVLNGLWAAGYLNLEPRKVDDGE